MYEKNLLTDTQTQDFDQDELVVLNLNDLVVEELEQRLELATCCCCKGGSDIPIT